jgi:glycosyltransferase EpsD
MKKILYTATSDVHLRTFHFPYLKWFIDEGYEVHVACENRGNIDLSFCNYVHYLPFKRSPLHLDNFKAFSSLKKIINDNSFDLIHCHTPAVSVVTRLAAISARKKGSKIMYTAHGYHFFKGSPIKLWLLYYPLEKLLSRWTDAIVLINEEDYLLTQKRFLNKNSFYIKGIGIDILRFPETSYEILSRKRELLNVTEDDFLLLYIAEFIPRKNHEFLIRLCKKLIESIPYAKFVFAGTGVLLEKMKTLAEDLEVSNHIRFLGWRNDISDLIQLADIGISSSKQEGLGLGLAEEMHFELPIVATLDRGHKEMIIHGVNGFMFDHGDAKSFIKYIKLLFQDKSKYVEFKRAAKQKSKEFLIENSLLSMQKIYNYYFKPNVN